MKLDKWKEFILPLKNRFEDLNANENQAREILSEVINNSVGKYAKGNFGTQASKSSSCGIAFSGGIDSSLIALIAKNQGTSFKCYTVGLENAQDIIFAKNVAEKLYLNLKYKILSLDELEDIVKNVVAILKEADVTKVSVGAVLYAILEMVKNDNVGVLFTGLGSEEIFAGYDRHLKALNNNDWKNVHEECWRGLKNMWQRDLSRDFAIAEKFGIRLVAPFLEKDVIVTAMSIHPKFKIDKNHKKIILREVAEALGLPKEFAWRQKKAAQYGSNFIKGMDKIAKRNGFRYKKDYLESLLNLAVK